MTPEMAWYPLRVTYSREMKFKAYLEQNGVKEIPTQGADFDTEYHEAVTTFPAPDPAQKGKVIDTVQKGYTLNDKVIRFAKVVVGE